MRELHFIKWFVYITTGILFICAVDFVIADVQALPKYTLWYILLSGFLTALVTGLIWGIGDTKKRSQVVIRGIFHYVALCAVMIVSGHWFGWLDYDRRGILMMVLSVAAVYALTLLFRYVLDNRQADAINHRLQEKYRDDEPHGKGTRKRR